MGVLGTNRVPNYRRRGRWTTSVHTGATVLSGEAALGGAGPPSGSTALLNSARRGVPQAQPDSGVAGDRLQGRHLLRGRSLQIDWDGRRFMSDFSHLENQMLCCGRNHKDDISVLGTLLTDHDYRSFIGCARNAVNEKAKVVAGKRQTRVLQPRHANREPQGELVGRITVKPGRQHPVRSRSCSCLSSGRKHHRILRGSGVGDRHGRGGGGVGSLRDRGLRLRSRGGMGLRGRPPSTSEHPNLVETHDRP